jgi:nitrogen fixation NifU-like protein
MNELRELYQQVIMDHNKNPRNFHAMDHATCFADGRNPLCGDQYTVFLKMDGDTVGEVSFQGAGCAISKASASIMSTVLKGKTRSEAEHLFELFQKIIRGEISAMDHLDELGKLAAFSGVAEFPSRVKCAILPWHAMHTALRGDNKEVSTEA